MHLEQLGTLEAIAAEKAAVIAGLRPGGTAVVPAGETLLAPHLRTEVKSDVQKLREELTEEEQTLLILRVDRNLDWREVADILEIEEPALRKRFERLKDKLRRLAKERGIGGR